METTKLIYDEQALDAYIEKYLDTTGPARYLVCLAARVKYHRDEAQRHASHLYKDRVLAYGLVPASKLKLRLKSWECRADAYTARDGTVLPSDVLTVYVNPNPRADHLVRHAMGLRLYEAAKQPQQFTELERLLYSCASRRETSVRMWSTFDVDLPDTNPEAVAHVCSAISATTLGRCHIMRTRGGLHVLVRRGVLTKTAVETTWYQTLSTIADLRGDLFSPVPGCTQGGFIPKWLYEFTPPATPVSD